MIDPSVSHCYTPSVPGRPLVFAALASLALASGCVTTSSHAGGVSTLHGESTARTERVGLSNTRARLDQEFGDRQSLQITRGDSGGTRVAIRIPWSTTAVMDGVGV